VPVAKPALSATDVFVTTDWINTYFDWVDGNAAEFSAPELSALFTRVLDVLIQLRLAVPGRPEPVLFASAYHELGIFVAQLRSAIAGKNPNMVIGPPEKPGIKKNPNRVRAAALEVARLLRDPRVLKLRELSRKPHVISVVFPRYALTKRTLERYYKEAAPNEEQLRHYIAALRWKGLIGFTEEEIESTRALIAKHGLTVTLPLLDAQRRFKSPPD
jgi:hypothetical protein